jgi:hypothetical protein
MGCNKIPKNIFARISTEKTRHLLKKARLFDLLLHPFSGPRRGLDRVPISSS